MITDLIQAGAAIIALALALVAICLTRRQGVKAQQDLAQERRTVFELGLLLDLLRSLDGHSTEIGPPQYARVAMLPPDELPVWRMAAAGTPDMDPEWWSRKLDDLGVPPGSFIWRMRYGYRGDLWRAIEHRVDQPPGAAESWMRAVVASKLESTPEAR